MDKLRRECRIRGQPRQLQVAGEHTLPPTPSGPREVATISLSDNGTSSHLPSPTLCNLNYPRPSFHNYKTIACGRLARRAFALHEFPSLIEAILASEEEGERTRSLPASGAQALIDVIDEARSWLLVIAIS